MLVFAVDEICYNENSWSHDHDSQYWNLL